MQADDALPWGVEPGWFLQVMGWFELAEAVAIRELDVQERHKVNAFYSLTTYKRPVSPSDRVFVSEHADKIYGAARIESLNGVQVLRGMYVHPDHVRQGIGYRLLSAMEPVLSETESFCIPRDHLFEFYARAGFKLIDEKGAPAFLVERLATYISDGLSVAIMRRPSGAPH